MPDFYCKNILRNKIKFKKIKETENVLAFFHTKPNYEFHVVIIPKEHIANLTDVQDIKIIQEIFEVIKSIVKEKKLINYRIIMNNGKFQDSKHLHFHLISDEYGK